MDEHTLNDLLECSVCLERLDTSSKVLPCQHTFCRKCLEVIYASRQELRCPECRVLVDTKIDDLPPNVLLMRILEGMKNAAIKQNHNVSEEFNRPSTNLDDRSHPHNPKEQQKNSYQQQQQQFQTKLILPMQQQQNQNQIPPSSTTTLEQQTSPPSSQQQQRRCIVPHAYALYDFDSNEPNDLKFKKGDLILLRRKIDSNWYVGQSKGCEGNFPINYVQVVVPIPQAQCVALYDFKMGPNEEEGCLTFKKGAVIQVLRRVDHNWAEGRLGSAIGIFPIAFVELNSLAKQLLENGYITSPVSHSQQQQMHQQQSNYIHTERYNESRSVPPIPSTSTNSTEGLSVAVSNSQINNSSSSSSSTTTSPHSTSTVTNTMTQASSLFHSMPNSPQSSSNPSTPQHMATQQITNTSSSVRLRNTDLKQKRHSLNALLNNGGNNALSILQTNRHSAEILSVPNDFETDADSRTSIPNTATSQTTSGREQQNPSSNISPSDFHSIQSTQNAGQILSPTPIQSTSTTGTPRHNVLKTCVQQNIPPSLPWGYLALYPYKPRKVDELELKKGCVYMVTERCLDGWFKGKNWKDISGVFPGNYVTPLRARDQQQLMHSWKLIPPPANGPTISGMKTTPQQQQQQFASNYSVSMRNDLENINARLTLANLTPHHPMPPDLPPRQLANSPTNMQTQPQPISSKELRDIEALKEKPMTTGCMSTSSSSSSSTANTGSSSSSSASAGLKKFLTHIKSRSKSPGAAIVATAAAANSSNQQTQVSQPSMNLNSVTPVHVRSGSCPSQLLHTLPNDVVPRGISGENKAIVLQQPPPPSAANYGSQRIKGPKERPSLDSSRPTIDSTLRSIYANHIQQQSALMPNKCGIQYQQQQQQHTSNTNSNIQTSSVVHRKSHSLDTSNFLKSSPQLNNAIAPTTSTSSLAGTTAAASNINAAAIHASATTKSAQNSMAESRFRCIVPYPPNSDVELELQVGDIIFVYRKQKNGWYKGTNSRTCKTGLFPASFVEPDL